MALPNLTPEQRASALQRAAQVRAERAGLKAKLKNGTVSLAEVMGEEVMAKVKVSAVLASMPGVGKVRAEQIMARIGISEKRRVSGLGANQKAALEAEFPAAELAAAG
jgi:hypothetical protein